MLAQKIHLAVGDLTFRRLGVQLVLPQSPKYSPQMSSMFLHSAGVDQYVVQKNDNILVQKIAKKVIHEIYELRGCIRDTEWHH